MKFRYLVGFAALALLASCSKQEVQDEKAWVYDETLPVPLTFSMPKVVVQPTKAMIEGESMDGEKVGIFALANGSGDWTASGDLVMLYNQAGTVTTSGDGNAGTLNFTSTEYYPMTNDLNFSLEQDGLPLTAETGASTIIQFDGKTASIACHEKVHF